MSIRRRTLITGAAVAAAAAAMGCGDREPTRSAPATGGSGPKDRPNILLLCIDDLNDWVGYLSSHPGAYTPHIDRLRAQSYSFNRAYCSVPVCIASRASVLWGLTPESTGVNDTGDDAAYWQLVRSPAMRPLPHWFSQAGYETISTGKVFHYQKGTPRLWDVFKPYRDTPHSWGEHGTLFDYGLLAPGEVHIDQVAANFTVEQLQKKRTRPWFMAIGLYQPHVPWRLPQWAFDLHPIEKVVLPEVRADDLDDIPPAGVTLAREPLVEKDGVEVTQHELVVNAHLWPEHVQAYLAACSHTDAMVGQIVDALDKSDYAGNTVIVLWSDNGFHLGEKLHWHKMALWERATRVPLLIRAPGLVQAGGGLDLPVSLLDLAPTLTDIAGIPRPSQFEGDSLLGVGAKNARPAHMRWGDAVSTRVGNWRWTRYPDGGEELYDLSVDPREYHNLLGPDDALEGGMEALLRM